MSSLKQLGSKLTSAPRQHTDNNSYPVADLKLHGVTTSHRGSGDSHDAVARAGGPRHTSCQALRESI